MFKLSLRTLTCAVLPPPDSGRALAAGEIKTLAALAEVLLEGSPLQICAEDVAQNVDRFLARGRSRRVWQCRVLLITLERATVVRFGARLSRLSTRQRRVFVKRTLSQGRGLWRVLGKVRYLVLMGAYGDARAAAPTGFVPIPLRARFRRRTLTKAGNDARPRWL